MQIFETSWDKGITSDIILTTFSGKTVAMGHSMPGRSVVFSALHQHLVPVQTSLAQLSAHGKKTVS